MDFYVPFHLFLNVMLLHCLEEKEKGEIIDCRLAHLQREREEKRKREMAHMQIDQKMYCNDHQILADHGQQFIFF